MKVDVNGIVRVFLKGMWARRQGPYDCDEEERGGLRIAEEPEADHERWAGTGGRLSEA